MTDIFKDVTQSDVDGLAVILKFEEQRKTETQNMPIQYQIHIDNIEKIKNALATIEKEKGLKPIKKKPYKRQ